MRIIDAIHKSRIRDWIERKRDVYNGDSKWVAGYRAALDDLAEFLGPEKR